MRKFWIALLSCITFVCIALGVACSGAPKLAFNEGYLEEVELGEPIMLDEYIDPNLTDDYTFILTHDETGEKRDLKMMGQWTTEVPGTYTITYTVNSGEYKGTISTKIKVVVPDARWQYSRPTLVYRAGETMEFNLLKRNLNISVNSYYNYSFFVKSVQIDGEKTDLTGQTSYTFQQAGEHVFTFGIQTEDGQVLTADQKVSVRPQQVLAEGAQEWMDENGITTYDYTLVSPDGKVSLDAGYYSTFIKDNVPYLAFNGAEGSEGYGANTYMMVDFTGKNLPQVAFFCDEVTSSFTDGKNGVLISNGTSLNDGSFWSDLDASRMTIFGPKKVQYAEFDNKGRMLALGSVADPCPISYNALEDGNSYRYIVGIEDAQYGSFVVRMILVNTTTGERLYDYEQKLSTYSGPSGNINLELSEDYYKGSIVLYGRYGIGLDFDKVYMPITGISDIYELDVAAEFKDGYKEQYNLNSYANVSDYIDIPDTDYEFNVIDPDGKLVEIDADGNFQYTKSGKYLLQFDSKQEGVRVSAISVRVMYDLENPLPADFLEKEGAIMASGDSGVKTNSKSDYVIEGTQSLEYYPINGRSDGNLILFISKNFMEFVFLAREVDGITFEVYSPKAASYSLFDPGPNDTTVIAQDYTGTIAAETWTKFTITREMCMRNFDVYNSQGYSIAITLTGEEKFFSREAVYIDNVELILKEVSPTLDSSVQTFLDENNMTAYGYEAINSDMSATLCEGIYQSDKNVDPFTFSHGIPELISIAVVVALHLWRRQMLLSIAGGTVCYMLLVQLVF